MPSTSWSSVTRAEFDVKLFTDPLYKTVVFETVSGRSKCPHERGTVPRENWVLEFEGGLKQLSITADSDTVQFEVDLINHSPTDDTVDSLWEIIGEDRGLTWKLDGVPWIGGLQGPWQTTGRQSSIIEVTRTSIHFDGDDHYNLLIAAYSECEWQMVGLFKMLTTQNTDFKKWYSEDAIGDFVNLTLKFPSRQRRSDEAPGDGAVGGGSDPASTQGECQLNSTPIRLLVATTVASCISLLATLTWVLTVCMAQRRAPPAWRARLLDASAPGQVYTNAPAASNELVYSDNC